MGVPRYVPIWFMVGTSRMLVTFSLQCRDVLGENQRRDLVTLTSCPEAAQNCWRIWISFVQSLALAWVNKKMSSAKNRCERRTHPRKLMGWRSLSRTASSSLRDNLSKQRLNRYGDKGSPYRTPRLGTTSGKGIPFQRIWNRVEDIMFMMRVMRLGGNWKKTSVSWIKLHSRRS